MRLLMLLTLLAGCGAAGECEHVEPLASATLLTAYRVTCAAGCDAQIVVLSVAQPDCAALVRDCTTVCKR